jgi:hypothetical protein
MADMVGQGFDADLVHEVESISTIAFGRAMFERLGVRYAPTVIRARRDGRVERDVPLMSLPAFTRARVLAEQLRSTMPTETFQALCCYNAESNAILQAMSAQGDRRRGKSGGGGFGKGVGGGRRTDTKTEYAFESKI